MSNIFIDNAKVMSKGQITIPKDIRNILGLSIGDHVTFIVEDNSVRIVNSAIYAMKIVQREMKGSAKKAGLKSEKDVIKMIKSIRQSEKNR